MLTDWGCVTATCLSLVLSRATVVMSLRSLREVIGIVGLVSVGRVVFRFECKCLYLVFELAHAVLYLCHKVLVDHDASGLLTKS